MQEKTVIENTGIAINKGRNSPVRRMKTKVCNCIVVFNPAKDAVLFCKRQKDPFKGRYNFVGGKIESGESSEHAAYRELQEETGITRKDIRLYRLMDFIYYHLDFILEIYVGILKQDVTLQEEVNPLEWLSLDEDYTDRERFAGEQNIAHIINVALMYPFPEHSLTQQGLFIGVDGCRGGWIAAIIQDGELYLKRYEKIHEITDDHPGFDAFLIDMAIGLPESENDLRPEKEARSLLKEKASTVFNVPSRQAVYADGEALQKKENISILGKSLSKQSIAIIPKIREVDEFLQEHKEYQNVICESHPELCFARLKGEVLLSKKSGIIGFDDRIQILSEFLPAEDLQGLWNKVKDLQCKPDDIVDAVCLAVVASIKEKGLCESIPENPQKDARGLLMQMIVPKG